MLKQPASKPLKYQVPNLVLISLVTLAASSDLSLTNTRPWCQRLTVGDSPHSKVTAVRGHWGHLHKSPVPGPQHGTCSVLRAPVPGSLARCCHHRSQQYLSGEPALDLPLLSLTVSFIFRCQGGKKHFSCKHQALKSAF